jgi:DNA-binding XRE family transcriptional regulator
MTPRVGGRSTGVCDSAPSGRRVGWCSNFRPRGEHCRCARDQPANRVALAGTRRSEGYSNLCIIRAMAQHIQVLATGLKVKRRQAGLTQRELARRLGVTQNYIPAIEAGSRQMSAQLRSSVCDLLSAEFDEIFAIVRRDDGAHGLIRYVPATASQRRD